MRRSIKNEIKVEEETPSIPVSVPHSIVWGLWVLYSRRSRQQTAAAAQGERDTCVGVWYYIYKATTRKKKYIHNRNRPIQHSSCVCLWYQIHLYYQLGEFGRERETWNSICCAVLELWWLLKMWQTPGPEISLGSVLTNWIRTILLPSSFYFCSLYRESILRVLSFIGFLYFLFFLFFASSSNKEETVAPFLLYVYYKRCHHHRRHSPLNPRQ